MTEKKKKTVQNCIKERKGKEGQWTEGLKKRNGKKKEKKLKQKEEEKEKKGKEKGN